ncbi:MAG: 3-oxoacyl-[acyl-carrier protein] reductase, partial [uncultured Gemmatimonadaceae bacterium]
GGALQRLRGGRGRDRANDHGGGRRGANVPREPGRRAGPRGARRRGGRRLRRARRAGQQRRHHGADSRRRGDRRPVGRDVRPQPARPLLRGPGGGRTHGRRWRDREHRGPGRVRDVARLRAARHQQGRRGADDARPGADARPAHPRERGGAGRGAPPRRVGRRDARPPRQHHAAPPTRRPRRRGGRRPLPARRRLRHRRDPDRRRRSACPRL